MIELKNLTYNYDSKFSALFEISFKMAENTVILSDELSSKTLFRILSKQYNDYSGEVIIDNKELKDTKIKDLNISYITNPPFLLKKTASYNLAYPLIIRKTNKTEALAKASNLLNKYDLQDKKIKQCSNFECILITLLRTLLRHPKFVLIDDIFINLNQNEIDLIASIINEISKTSIILISLNKSQNIFNDYSIIKLFNGKVED